MLTCDIKQEHIDKSEPMLETKNPLGFALREIFPNSIVHVGIRYAHIDNRTLVLSPEIVAYLEEYDINGIAKPITFELDLDIS